MMNDLFIIVDKVDQSYTKQPNAILRDPDLTDAAVRVLCFLLSISKEFNPTIKKIAKTLHMSEKKVQRALTLLKNTGYISISRVKNGSLYGGMKWQVSHFHGHFNPIREDNSEIIQETTDKNDHIYVDKNDWVENDQICMDKNDQIHMDKNDIVENVPIQQDKINYVENDHISQLPIGQQTTDVNYQGQLPEYQLPLLQQTAQAPDVEEVFQRSSSGSFSSESSSEANASPLQGKKPGQGEQVISQTEYLYQQLRNKYPPHRLGDYADGFKAFQSIPDIATVYPEIVRGLESWKQSESWSNEDGRYVPGLVKFLNERKWKIPPTWNNSASGTNNYANSDARKAVAEKWHQLETQSYITDSIGD